MMDLLAALRIYGATYRSVATQLRHPRIVRAWMETMADCRAATREELEEYLTSTPTRTPATTLLRRRSRAKVRAPQWSPDAPPL